MKSYYVSISWEFVYRHERRWKVHRKKGNEEKLRKGTFFTILFSFFPHEIHLLLGKRKKVVYFHIFTLFTNINPSFPEYVCISCEISLNFLIIHFYYQYLVGILVTISCLLIFKWGTNNIFCLFCCSFNERRDYGGFRKNEKASAISNKSKWRFFSAFQRFFFVSYFTNMSKIFYYLNLIRSIYFIFQIIIQIYIGVG